MTPAAIPAALWLDLVGAPFVEGGRGPVSFDCVGLAMEVARRRGLSLPAYLSEPEELHRQLAQGGLFDESRFLFEPEPGAVALLRTGVHGRHLGTMIDRFRMLHTEAGTAAVVERILSDFWQRRILGFYRIDSHRVGP